MSDLVISCVTKTMASKPDDAKLTNTPASLLTLPPELRLVIYEHVFGDHIEVYKLRHRMSLGEFTQCEYMPALVAVCRKLRTEGFWPYEDYVRAQVKSAAERERQLWAVYNNVDRSVRWFDAWQDLKCLNHLARKLREVAACSRNQAEIEDV